MKKIVCTFLLVFVFCIAIAHAGILDNFMKNLSSPASKGQSDNDKVVSGLKEALYIGTEKAINSVSQTDGFFWEQDD